MVRYQAEEAYDLIAQEYAVRHQAMPERLVELGERFLGYLAKGAHILDVGCGSGRDMAWMEAQGFRTTGIDLSSGMLAQARQRVRGQLRHMDMCHLTFPDASFEGIWCSSSLLHVPHALAPVALGQMHRVLVPAGMLFLSLLEGENEMWESEISEFAHVQRLFVHYRQTVITTSLSHAGFVPVEQYRDTAGNHVWLNVLAQAVG
ncbi:methyltransferase [Reticulibacter mediterranei]|uniref:Methyltransferase n=1 Tax=Reticulibacter mediterranei TaxID=2778369 RepID=A0A8J3IDQ2_9CHLR|nr:class I SAM-dependent methyltransferase [Reticulibacter mediterranei]GHO93494.1 methyltransferase [Reticulibacter mediterranei]